MSCDLLPPERPAALAGCPPRRITPLGDGCTIAWAEMGAGPDLLAIHGTLMTLEDMWLGPAPALAEHFRVIAVDRPGHGLSRRRRFVDASPLRQAELLHEFAVATGLRRPLLLGHSYGGAVALAYAMLYPDEIGGILVLAPLCLPELRMELMLLGPRALPLIGDILAPLAGVTTDPALLPLLWRAMFLPQRMPDAFAKDFPFPLAASFDQMIAEGEDAAASSPALAQMAACYAGCRVPTRIFGGSADIVINNALNGLATATAMPRARFDWLPGIGHMIHHHAIGDVVEAAASMG